jgi:hypothetical protein
MVGGKERRLLSQKEHQSSKGITQATVDIDFAIAAVIFARQTFRRSR